MLGLSGGIDSTLVALIAVDALGADRVTCVTMPSRYSSEGTRGRRASAGRATSAWSCSRSRSATAMEAYDELLADAFAGREPDITEENLQARIRGNLLMALSNKFGWLVLTTGNKSEISVGYSTLYGDTAGGFAVIKDVPKTLVYRLVDLPQRARRRRSPVPGSIVDRPPSAELRADQTDADSLPDYDTLDPILEAYVEEDADREQLESHAGCPRRRRRACSRWSTAPSTSAARRRPGSRSRRARSAATGGCRSRTCIALAQSALRAFARCATALPPWVAALAVAFAAVGSASSASPAAFLASSTLEWASCRPAGVAAALWPAASRSASVGCAIRCSSRGAVLTLRSRKAYG